MIIIFPVVVIVIGCLTLGAFIQRKLNERGRDFWLTGQHAHKSLEDAQRFKMTPKPPIIHVREVL